MLKIKEAIVVEGRYDKNSLSQVVDTLILETAGFGIFKKPAQMALLRKAAQVRGLIVLTDSDGGGKQIRKFLSGILPKEKIHHLYIPQIEGKESRKRKPSASGNLGVEGMEKDVLIRLLTPFVDGEMAQKGGKMITKVDFFADKLTGCEGAFENRRKICEVCDLPQDMTTNALLEALNLLYGYDEYKRLVEKFITK